jgi:hypothetical protein
MIVEHRESKVNVGGDDDNDDDEAGLVLLISELAIFLGR